MTYEREVMLKKGLNLDMTTDRHVWKSSTDFDDPPRTREG